VWEKILTEAGEKDISKVASAWQFYRAAILQLEPVSDVGFGIDRCCKHFPKVVKFSIGIFYHQNIILVAIFIHPARGKTDI